MISPTLFPLLFALILCIPVAVIFTFQREFTGFVSGGFSLNSRNVPDSSSSSSPPVRIRQPIPKDDEPLLRLAARVNPKQPPGSTRKLAFMYLTTSPLPFASLWEMYFDGISKDLYNVYVHVDPIRDYDPPFSGVFKNRVIHSKPTMRHSPTLLAAARRLLAHALLDDPLNYIFALISPSCVPLHSFDFTYKTLVSPRKSFLEIKDEPWKVVRWKACGDDAMLPEVTLEEFRVGSQFWVLKRKHARMVARDRRIWLKFNQRCVDVGECYPDESYFATLLNKRDPSGCVPATLTHVDWSVTFEGHPRMYEANETVPELIERIRKTRPYYGKVGINGSEWSAVERMDPFLFARKFCADALEPLLGMARTVLFNDSAGSV